MFTLLLNFIYKVKILMRQAFLRLVIITVFLVLISACERSERKFPNKTPEIKDTIFNSSVSQSKILEQKDLKIKLYIENSGSMFGYVNGRTQLKDMLQNLLVDLKYEYDEENIEIYFINSKIYASPIKVEVVDFADKLSPYSIKIGQTGSSDLNDIFRQITSETDENSISILVSDFIYSIKGKETIQLLGQQQALTKNVFLTADKKGQKLTTNVYQFHSDFNGKYYDYNDDSTFLKGKRPYYLAIIGQQNSVNLFTNQIGPKFNKYKGYSNEYLLTAEDFDVTDYTVLTSTLNYGRIKPVKGTNVSGQVRQIELEESGRDGSKIQFAVAVNLNSLVITDDYISTITNYELSNDVFSLLKIGKITGDDIVFANGDKAPFSASDLQHVKLNPTHVFVFQSSNKNIENLTFSLKRNIPQWIANSSLFDDTDLTTNESKQQKTFGLEYLINGISSAYLQATEKDSYFNITIPIQKPKPSSLAAKAIGFIFLALLIALITRVILKRKTRK
ncbi:MAG: hypothetical protein ACJASR_000592 [Psychroserpens sp.]|jgi:hypothetical protein